MVNLSRKAKLFLVLIAVLLMAIPLALYASSCYIENKAAPHLHTGLEYLPDRKVGLVLGTSSRLKSGADNLYFLYRVQGAARLYHAGKVKYLIVSGDNGRKEYDEATDMRDALVELGVPRNKIYLDYAGFRTLDSVVRCDKIFDQTDFTIISQKFHNQRAVYLAHAFGLNAVAYNCKDVSYRTGKLVLVRETLARFKAVLDVVFNKQPKYLGEKVIIGQSQKNTNDKI